MNTENFFDATIDEVMKGYIEHDYQYECLICHKTYEKGQIYQSNQTLYDAKKQTEIHVIQEHQGMLNYLLKLNPDVLGISSLQQEMLQCFAESLSDKEIAVKQKISTSTIRSYRYKLREKEKQARLFLAMMTLLEEQTKRSIKQTGQTMLCDAPKTATTLDERFNITQAEKDKLIPIYFDENGSLKEYPSKEKRKIIVLEVIAKNFKYDTIYSETEINRILKRIFNDHVTLRRALIEYGFMNRNDDGSKYWVTM